jgi:hypothetical protein
MYKNNALIFLIAFCCYSTNIHSMKRTLVGSYEEDIFHLSANTSIIFSTAVENGPQEIVPRPIPSRHEALLETVLIANIRGVPIELCNLFINYICPEKVLWAAFGTPDENFNDCDKETIQALANPWTLGRHKINSSGVEETCLDFLLGAYSLKYRQLVNSHGHGIALTRTKAMVGNILDILDIILPRADQVLITKTNEKDFCEMTSFRRSYDFDKQQFLRLRDLMDSAQPKQ